MGYELLVCPHILFREERRAPTADGVVLLDGVVAEVDAAVHVLQAEGLGAEAQVARLDMKERTMKVRT